LLCGLYRRAFLVERDQPVEQPSQGGSPFLELPSQTAVPGEVVVAGVPLQTTP
jgi:hypothetical protein